MAKSAKLYSKSPSLKRGDDGEMGVHTPTEADGENMGAEGNPLPATEGQGQMPIQVHQSNERHELHHKHVHEHLAVHKRHEAEHATHSGDKKELHKRHESEIKSMHDRHHTELVEMHKRHAASHTEPKGKGEMKEAEPHSAKVE